MSDEAPTELERWLLTEAKGWRDKDGEQTFVDGVRTEGIYPVAMHWGSYAPSVGADDVSTFLRDNTLEGTEVLRLLVARAALAATPIPPVPAGAGGLGREELIQMASHVDCDCKRYCPRHEMAARFRAAARTGDQESGEATKP